MIRYLFFISLLAVMMPAHAEKVLMKLFYTPAERAAIDIQQESKLKAKSSDAATAVTSTIEAKGFARQHGKKPVVWINDSNTLKGQKVLPDVRVKSVNASGKIKIAVQGKGTLKLKPGQVVSRSRRGVSDLYENKE